MSTSAARMIDPFDPWLIAKNRFVKDLDPRERALFDGATPENLYYKSSNTERADAKNSKTRAVLHSLQPLTTTIEDYGKALDSFANTASLYLAPVWGSIRVVLIIANSHGKFYDRMIDTFARVGDILPRLRDYQGLFDREKYPRFTEVLSAAYLDIIILCSDFRRVLLDQKTSFVNRVLKPLSPSLRSHCDKSIQKFRDHRQAVESEAQVCHRIEAKKARELVLRNEMFSRLQQKELAQKRLIWRMSPIYYQYKHRQMQKTRHNGTGRWLCEMQEYKDWRDCEKSSIMSCYGIPGCGKSVLVSGLIDGSRSVISGLKPNTTTAYYYCDYADKRTLSTTGLFSCISQQLLRTIHHIPNTLMATLESMYADDTSSPDLDQVSMLLVDIIHELLTVVVFIDGIDEMPEDERKLAFKTLRDILNATYSPVKLLITSRGDTTYLFQGCSGISLYRSRVYTQSLVTVIRAYLRHSIRYLIEAGDLAIGDPELENDIFLALEAGAQGMFLWVKFQLDELCRMETDASISNALLNLPRDLEETYDRLLARVLGEERREYVKRMFNWIIGARRPLGMSELREAIAFTVADESWDSAKIPNEPRRLVRACGNLVVIDEDNEIVQLAHHTVEQYTLHRWTSTLQYFHITREEANQEIGKIPRHNNTEYGAVLEKAVGTQPIIPYSSTAVKGVATVANVMSGFRITMEHKPKEIEFSRHLPRKARTSRDVKDKYSLLSYVKDNWLWHATSFTEETRMSITGHRFRELVFHKHLSFSCKPWDAFGSKGPMMICVILRWAMSTLEVEEKVEKRAKEVNR